MDFQVLIADSALTDLQGIVEFVARDDRDAAIRLGDKLVDCALSLRAAERSIHHHQLQSEFPIPRSEIRIPKSARVSGRAPNVKSIRSMHRKRLTIDHPRSASNSPPVLLPKFIIQDPSPAS